MSLEHDQAQFLRCIGEATRLRILRYLISGEKCVTDIVSAVGKEQSLVSHHLKSLKDCNIVLTTQKAQKIYYSLADPRLAEIILQTETVVKELPLCQREKPCDE